MKTSDRLLVGILGGIGVLVIAGIVALIAVGNRAPEEFSENAPEGVVQRYLRALEEGRGDAAYGYLSESVKDDFVRRNYQRYTTSASNRTRRIVLDRVEAGGDEARVAVSVSTITPSGPATNPEYTTRIDFQLKREEAGWRIIAPLNPPFLG